MEESIGSDGYNDMLQRFADVERPDLDNGN